MSGPERKRPQFAPKEEEKIDLHASLFAELGEEAIDDLRRGRDGFMRLRFILLKAGSDDTVFQVAQTLAHEIELVSEVIDRADRNMRMAGTDRTSKIRKLLVRDRLGYLNDQAPGEEER
jgi:hypothetical protein